MDHDVGISPDPPDDEREAILAAVRALLEREEQLARPSVWRVSGWTAQRRGLTDLGRHIDPVQRWARSMRFPFDHHAPHVRIGRGDAR